MGKRRFSVLLRGLSGESVWRHALASTPEIVEGAAAAALIDRM